MQGLWTDPDMRNQLCAKMKRNWAENKVARTAQTLETLGEDGLQQRNQAISASHKQRFEENPALGTQANERLNKARAEKRASLPVPTVEDIREKNRKKAENHRAKVREKKAADGIPNGRSSEATLARLEDPEAKAARDAQMKKARDANKRRIEAEDPAVATARAEEQKRRKAEIRKANASGTAPPPPREGSAAALRAKPPETLTDSEKMHLARLDRINAKGSAKKAMSSSEVVTAE